MDRYLNITSKHRSALNIEQKTVKRIHSIHPKRKQMYNFKKFSVATEFNYNFFFTIYFGQSSWLKILSEEYGTCKNCHFTSPCSNFNFYSTTRSVLMWPNVSGNIFELFRDRAFQKYTFTMLPAIDFWWHKYVHFLQCQNTYRYALLLGGNINIAVLHLGVSWRSIKYTSLNV